MVGDQSIGRYGVRTLEKAERVAGRVRHDSHVLGSRRDQTGGSCLPGDWWSGAVIAVGFCDQAGLRVSQAMLSFQPIDDGPKGR